MEYSNIRGVRIRVGLDLLGLVRLVGLVGLLLVPRRPLFGVKRVTSVIPSLVMPAIRVIVRV